MNVDMMRCPVCEQPRAWHEPACRYEKTFQAQAERFSEALREFGRTLAKSLHLR